jgi:hypothetical protein
MAINIPSPHAAPVPETSTETAAEKLRRIGSGEGAPPTFAEKLRAAGYQEPVLPASQPPVVAEPAIDPVALVSREGFRAGVICSAIGGALIIGLYVGAGPLITGCVASGCAGFVCGMLATADWK